MKVFTESEWKAFSKTRARTHVFVFLLVFGTMLQSLYLVHLQAKVSSNAEVFRLLKENSQIRSETTQMLENLCDTQIRVGNVYRSALVNLTERLGIDKTQGTIAVLLHELGGIDGP